MEFTAKQLAQVLHGTVDGDPQTKVSDIAKIEHGKPGQLCFYANPKYEQYVAEDTGSAINGCRIDIFTGNHREAKELGVKEIELYW